MASWWFPTGPAWASAWTTKWWARNLREEHGFFPQARRTRHLIARNSPVAGDDREPLQTRLRDLYPIERVCMYRGSSATARAWRMAIGRCWNRSRSSASSRSSGAVQLSELSLDGDLPGCRRAHEDRPAGIGDELARPAGDRRRIVQPPEQDVPCRATARSVGAARKRRLHRRRQLVEVIGDPDLTAPLSPASGSAAPVVWNEPGYRVARLADDDLLAIADPLDEPGEVRLGIMNRCESPLDLIFSLT